MNVLRAGGEGVPYDGQGWGGGERERLWDCIWLYCAEKPEAAITQRAEWVQNWAQPRAWKGLQPQCLLGAGHMCPGLKLLWVFHSGLLGPAPPGLPSPGGSREVMILQPYITTQ